METTIVIGVGVTTIGFAMALLLAAAAKRPKRDGPWTGDSSTPWIDAGGSSDSGGSGCDPGASDGGSCDGGGGDGGGGGGGD